MDSLLELHTLFLRKCLTQCLLGPRAGEAYRTIHGALKMIVTFCSVYEDYVKTGHDHFARLVKLGHEFRKSMVDIVRTTHALVQTLDLAEERDSLFGLLMTLDYSGFYTASL